MRRLRIAIGAASLLVISAYGLDLHSLVPDSLARWILWFQLTPTALRLSQGDIVAGLGVLAVLGLTLCWGRVYCSFLCPLGVLFDVIGRLNRKRKYTFKPASSARYLFLAATLIPLFVGSLFALTLLDPYANFGRISAQLFRPIAIWGNNVLALPFETAGNYSIPPIPYRGYAWSVFAAVAGYVVFIIILAWRTGRSYCNLFCPVGALLGLVSQAGRSAFRITNQCTRCRRCQHTCKASCIDLEQQYIDMSRCVACFNCTAVCPEGAVTFGRAKPPGPTKLFPLPLARRRAFLKQTLAVPGLFLTSVEKRPDTLSIIPTARNTPILPPGAQSMDHFAARCTGCTTCVARCPSQVLQPTLLDMGPGKPLLPHLDPEFGFCNYECTSCGDVCPNGAILPLAVKDKKRTQIGQVKLEIENCIVRTRKTDCGACSEHCPTQAVSMKPRGKLKEPVITPDTCIGCGACEFICPSRPFRAIWVEGNKVQKQAEKPDFGKLAQPKDNEGFPF